MWSLSPVSHQDCEGGNSQERESNLKFCPIHCTLAPQAADAVGAVGGSYVALDSADGPGVGIKFSVRWAVGN